MSASKEKRSIGKHACERCRKSKTRCLLDTFDEHGKCRKCFLANLECTWKEISTTRRRRRTDVRVSELEKQIKNFENVLTGLGHGATSAASKANSYASPGEASSAGPRMSPDCDEMTGHVVSYHALAEEQSSFPLPHHGPLAELLHGTTIIKEVQAELFRDFIVLLLPQYPVIALASHETFDSLAQAKPLLASSILTAASSVSRPRQFEELHTKMVRMLSEEVLVRGQKSLEIVQAVLLCAVWYNPPTKIENLTFQLCNMAGTVALELGLGGRTSWHSNHRVVAGFKADVSNVAIESFRTMFSVYLTCSRVAISLRRQRMISFSPGTEIALQTFEEHATSPNDKRLIAWVRLQLIAEDVEKMKTNVESRTDSLFTDKDMVKNDLSLFDDRLAEWEAGTSPALLSDALRIDLCFCKCKLHELAIYADHNIEDLSIPYLSPAKAVNTHSMGTATLNPTYVRALLSFVHDCRAILDAVLATDVAVLRQCPLLTHLRIPYAFKALAMLRKALDAPGRSNVSKIIDGDTLKFEYYVSALSTHVEAASCQGLFSAPSAALKIRDLVARSSAMNSQVSKTKGSVRDEMLPQASTPTMSNKETASQTSKAQDGLATSNPDNLPHPDDGSMIYQPHEIPILPPMDDSDLLYFDFGPEFMDWTVW